MLCYPMLPHAVLCHAVQGHAMLCHAMLVMAPYMTRSQP